MEIIAHNIIVLYVIILKHLVELIEIGAMDFIIRKIENKDRSEILLMMEEFYSSDAVFTNGSREIFEKDFDNCISSCPFLEGFVFEQTDIILGYAMIAKSFSTEFGRICVWFEDLYIKKEYRGQGIISKFIDYIEKSYPESLLRLEVEKENSHALYVYKKKGFSILPYVQMKKFS